MRIVSGKYGGRTLLEFKGDKVRPTLDKVRESLFNIIAPKIMGASFCDLFCGTGAVGIEALSRGAKKVVFTDNSKASIDLTKKNLEKLKIFDVEVSFCDSIKFLQTTKEKFDFVFIDPPYKTDLGVEALKIISERDVLEEDGLIIFESEDKKQVDFLTEVDQRKYGRAILSFYKKGEL